METDGGENKRWDGRGTMRGCACARARERGGNYEMGGGRKDMISSYSSSLSCSRLMSSLCTVYVRGVSAPSAKYVTEPPSTRARARERETENKAAHSRSNSKNSGSSGGAHGSSSGSCWHGGRRVRQYACVRARGARGVGARLTYASRYGCASASSTVIRFLGSNVCAPHNRRPD